MPTSLSTEAVGRTSRVTPPAAASEHDSQPVTGMESEGGELAGLEAVAGAVVVALGVGPAIGVEDPAKRLGPAQIQHIE